MPTIKLVNPAGGGDYTTLATWEDFADGELTADQWAECYAGALAQVSLASWASTPTDSLYPRIYAASGQEGTLSGGATITGTTRSIISGSMAKLVVEGLHIVCDSGATDAGIYHLGSTFATKLYVNRCVFSGGSGFGAVRFTNPSADGSVLSILNSLFVRNSAGSSCGPLVSSSNANSFSMVMLNNTLNAGGSASASSISCASGTLALEAKNNVAFGSASADFGGDVTNITIDADNNASSDGTADSFLGGDNNKNNIVAADCFVDPDNHDYTLLASGVLHAAGIPTSNAESLDGTARNQYSSPSIGSYESENTTSRRTLLTGVG